MMVLTAMRQSRCAACTFISSSSTSGNFRSWNHRPNRTGRHLVQSSSKSPQSQDRQQRDKEKQQLQQQPGIKRQLEDELRDPKNFVEYFLPRPLRLAFFGFSAVSCFVGSLIAAAKLIQEPALEAAGLGAQNLVVNLIGCAVFATLWSVDQSAAETRVEQRRQLRQAQIRQGDREVFVNEQGETMSRLKEVNDDWVLRKLEGWGKRDGMPFLGPKKGAILQQLVQQQQPQLAVEVGSMAGYSAILIAQVLPRGSRLISIDKDLSWVLVAKRFLWQASQGEKNRQRSSPLGSQVDVWWGDACTKMSEVSANCGDRLIDFLLLDGTPKETLEYLKAAEGYLSPGAMVVADNAGVFAEGGMRAYLDYVRGNPAKYSTKFIESTLEWRDDVPDGLEVSIYQPAEAAQEVAVRQAEHRDTAGQLL